MELTAQKVHLAAAASSQTGGTDSTKEDAQVTGRKCAIGDLDKGGTGDVGFVDYRQLNNVTTWHLERCWRLFEHP